MNEELVEAMQDPSDTPERDPTPSPEEETAVEKPSSPETTKRGEADEKLLEEDVEAPVLSETPDQDPDPDRGSALAKEQSAELERLRGELTLLRAELSKRDLRLEQMSKEFEEFNTIYPNIPLSTLQDSVWDDVRRGIPVAAAYALAMRRMEHTAQTAAFCNQQNASRSSGALQPTEPDYFSPAEVRAMSQSEVRANYHKIMQSMQKWR